MATRASYSCARCYRRKKKCDRRYPSCSQCSIAKANCIALDRGSNSELPRSLISYLKRPHYTVGAPAEIQAIIPQAEEVHASLPATSFQKEQENVAAAYTLATATAKNSAPVVSLNRAPRSALPYYRVFFMGAELPFPLAFQRHRPISIPCSLGGVNFTRLPEEVADKLMAVYLDRILPQYPLFLEQDIRNIFQRFKLSGGGLETVTADEQFTIYMILAISTLSSRTRNYRKLLSVAESLRRDVFLLT
ncbi:hypothetical protein BDW59DRAFT_145961 [Aspergillus cavernicola]|uniref:Zn(2)-C6 fungal-type domain-containing protein n=1 Tax=Aspergillus cavernicola TaxID=176166 RepID=A0ABR4ICT2_9EURO